MGRGDYGEETPYEVVNDRSRTESEREATWETAASLQAVDGLRPSDNAYAAAEGYITGELTSSELERVIESAYSEGDPDPGEKEADIVSARIVGLLETSPFTFKPRQLASIHRTLFTGVLEPSWVGVFRSVDLSKPEPVLGGRTVQYCHWRDVAPSLEYDFGREATRNRGTLGDFAEIGRLSRFIANVWQCHPFREGNTRTTAVFTELYLRSLGAEVDNEVFRGNGVLFRDALVRANFSSIAEGIPEEPAFLAAFLDSVVNSTPFPFKHSELNLHGIREPGAEIAYREDDRVALPVPAENRVSGLPGADGAL